MVPESRYAGMPLQEDFGPFEDPRLTAPVRTIIGFLGITKMRTYVRYDASWVCVTAKRDAGSPGKNRREEPG
jgi:hypothetical protein